MCIRDRDSTAPDVSSYMQQQPQRTAGDGSTSVVEQPRYSSIRKFEARPVASTGVPQLASTCAPQDDSHFRALRDGGAMKRLMQQRAPGPRCVGDNGTLGRTHLKVGAPWPEHEGAGLEQRRNEEHFGPQPRIGWSPRREAVEVRAEDRSSTMKLVCAEPKQAGSCSYHNLVRTRQRG
eukprot:TRINITY_DN5604_c0_g1_i8.p1 TRINITY_DN5604_c0_g1~~TRINITY_DN5604_c0_g1_i8.p1  ORF type:complete len:178 (-),score=21.62 TRINITY_DN5604_c0_g1_i8:40-573(-)